MVVSREKLPFDFHAKIATLFGSLTGDSYQCALNRVAIYHRSWRLATLLVRQQIDISHAEWSKEHA
jgi:hypothetical protein